MKGFDFGPAPPLVWTTTKVAIALLSLLAAKWLSYGRLDQHTLLRLAGGGPVEEPTMTGDLAKARGTTLDPGAAPKRS